MNSIFPSRITSNWYPRTFGHGETRCHFILPVGGHFLRRSQSEKTPQPPILRVFNITWKAGSEVKYKIVKNNSLCQRLINLVLQACSGERSKYIKAVSCCLTKPHNYCVSSHQISKMNKGRVGGSKWLAQLFFRNMSGAGVEPKWPHALYFCITDFEVTSPEFCFVP